MKTSLCINERNGDFIKPHVIADYNIDDNTLKEPSSGYQFIKTDDNVELVLGKTALWDWDDTPSTSIFSKESNNLVDICEIIRLNPEVKIDVSKLDKRKTKTIVNKLLDGIDVTNQYIDIEKKVFLIICSNKETSIGLLLNGSAYTLEGSIIRYQTNVKDFDSCNFFTLNNKDIFDNGSTIRYSKREFCMCDVLIDLGVKLYIKDYSEMAEILIKKYLDRKSVKRRTHEKPVRTLDELVKRVFDNKENVFSTRTAYYDALSELRNDEYLISSICNRAKGLDEQDALVQMILENDEDYRSKCEDKIKDDALKTIKGQIEVCERNLNNLKAKEKKAEIVIKKSELLEKEYETKRSNEEQRFEKEKKEHDTSLKIISEEKDKISKELNDKKEEKERISSEIEKLQHILDNIVESNPIIDKIISSLNENNNVVLNNISKDVCSSFTKVVSAINDLSSAYEERNSNALMSAPVENKKLQKIQYDKVQSEELADTKKIRSYISKNLESYGISDGDPLSDFIVASISSKHNFVVSGDRFNIVGNSISSIIDSKKADVYFIENDCLQDIFNEICTSESRVFILEGELCLSSLKLFINLSKYSGKIIIFNINDVRLLTLSPQELWVYASFIDLDGEVLADSNDLKYNSYRKYFESNCKQSNFVVDESMTKAQQLSVKTIVGNMSDKEERECVDRFVEIIKETNERNE